MQADDEALKRWWNNDGPKIKRELAKRFRVHGLDERTTRMLVAATGEAFRAGWRARETMQEAEGTQIGLLDE